MILKFSLSDIKNSDISGYDLGHIEIGKDDKIITSANRSPDQAMMVFIAIVSLLDGLRKFLKDNSKSYKFVGTDSSFSITFSKSKRSNISMSAGNEFKDTVTKANLIKCVYDSCLQFYNAWGIKLSASDPVKEDIEAALSDFAELLK